MPGSEPAVRVAGLNKTFLVPEREAGLRAAVKSLFRRQHREVRAVDEISFEIAPGEVVGFVSGLHGGSGSGRSARPARHPNHARDARRCLGK